MQPNLKNQSNQDRHKLRSWTTNTETKKLRVDGKDFFLVKSPPETQSADATQTCNHQHTTL